MSVNIVSKDLSLSFSHTASVKDNPASSELQAQKRWQKLAEGLLKRERDATIKALKDKAPQPQFLHWKNRPSAVRARIAEDFDGLAKKKDSMWPVNGEAQYKLLDVNEAQLIKRLIQQAPATQKDFYFLDLGAGGFQWGDHLAEFLNAQTDLPKDITFHIINARGESYEGEAITTSGACKIHKLGAFKVEDLESELRKYGFSTRCLDFVISRLCMLHLVDPVGTFEQVYNQLRPKTGHLLSDAFTIRIGKDDDRAGYNGQERDRLLALLRDTRAPFLIHDSSDYILRRPDDAPARISFRYAGLDDDSKYSKNSRALYKRDISIPVAKRNLFELHGDRDLYDWLDKNALMSTHYKPKWVPCRSVEQSPEKRWRRMAESLLKKERAKIIDFSSTGNFATPYKV
jgi:hypothetical protein